MTKQSNYDYMRDQMQVKFLDYDQEAMLRKHPLKYDDDYIYLTFTGKSYRVNRRTGVVQWSEDAFVHATQGDFNESMTIFDILCYAKDSCCLSHEFCLLNELKGTIKFAGPGMEFFVKYTKRFDKDPGKLKEACELLGGTPYPKGDIAYTIPLFDFLPVVLQFWESDDEFDAVLKLMWDKNILDYMHFETTFYAAICLFERISQLMES